MIQLFQRLCPSFCTCPWTISLANTYARLGSISPQRRVEPLINNALMWLVSWRPTFSENVLAFNGRRDSCVWFAKEFTPCRLFLCAALILSITRPKFVVSPWLLWGKLTFQVRSLKRSAAFCFMDRAPASVRISQNAMTYLLVQTLIPSLRWKTSFTFSLAAQKIGLLNLGYIDRSHGNS